MSSDATDIERLKRNLQLTFELHEAGMMMMRQNLRRRFPEEAEKEISQRLQRWLEERPLLGELVDSRSRSGVSGDLTSWTS